MLMLDLRLQAETPGVTHFGAYHRPPDGHFFQFHPNANCGSVMIVLNNVVALQVNPAYSLLLIAAFFIFKSDT